MNGLIEGVDPAWVAALSAAAGGAIALRIAIHWCMVRTMFRGSGAAIIALLGEPSCKVLRTEGTGVDGPISSRSKDVYVVVGREDYLLCHQDLERLRDHGYIYLSGSSQDSSFKLSRLGELFLSRYDNSPWLARGIRRVRHPSRFRCYGGRLLRCRCQKRTRRVAGREIPLPCFLWNVK